MSDALAEKLVEAINASGRHPEHTAALLLDMARDLCDQTAWKPQRIRAACDAMDEAKKHIPYSSPTRTNETEEKL